MRLVGTPGPICSATCQAIASPSRSGSVARKTRLAAFAAFLISETVWVLPLMVTYSGVNVFPSISTPSFRVGRSRTWPTVAFTEYPAPRYFPIVFALVGDSTMTSASPARIGAPAGYFRGALRLAAFPRVFPADAVVLAFDAFTAAGAVAAFAALAPPAFAVLTALTALTVSTVSTGLPLASAFLAMITIWAPGPLEFQPRGVPRKRPPPRFGKDGILKALTLNELPSGVGPGQPHDLRRRRFDRLPVIEDLGV